MFMQTRTSPKKQTYSDIRSWVLDSQQQCQLLSVIRELRRRFHFFQIFFFSKKSLLTGSTSINNFIDLLTMACTRYTPTLSTPTITCSSVTTTPGTRNLGLLMFYPYNNPAVF